MYFENFLSPQSVLYVPSMGHSLVRVLIATLLTASTSADLDACQLAKFCTTDQLLENYWEEMHGCGSALSGGEIRRETE
jgi:hypothetical protein